LSSTGTATDRITDRVWQEVAGRCQFCHWRRDLGERTLPAMTAVLVLLAVLVLVDVAVGVRTVRRNRPAFPPASRPDWDAGGLPSHPYGGYV
jgi:hypothetical protein